MDANLRMLGKSQYKGFSRTSTLSPTHGNNNECSIVTYGIDSVFYRD
jgi:hypothetical protein